MKRIYNYVVLADDEEHIWLCSPNILPVVEVAWETEVRPTAVTVKIHAAVRFWVENRDDESSQNYAFLVVGTGNELDDHWEYVATAPRSNYDIIYHLYRRKV